jgi:hypothetical protein
MSTFVLEVKNDRTFEATYSRNNNPSSVVHFSTFF